MLRQNNSDIVKTLQRLTNAADKFVNRAPRVKRIQNERSSLLDAITDAQLVLSVHRLPKEKDQEQESATRSKRSSLLEQQLQKAQATLNDLERRLRPLGVELGGLQSNAQKAKELFDTILETSEFLERKKAV
jgi:predicted  nucleic acid-binding Zn-ribbon protein